MLRQSRAGRVIYTHQQDALETRESSGEAKRSELIIVWFCDT